MDLTKALAPKSDQANADDFIAGPRTFTVEKVQEGSSEQPVNVHLVEYPGKPFRPSKSMLRVLVAGWSKDTKVWAGRRLTLYRDPDVMWAGEKVGGIRISHMSHLDKPLSVSLTITRGNKKPFRVQPLNDAPATPGITQQTWGEINSLAAEKRVENVPAWISEQLGRKLQGWIEITEAEGDQLLETLTTGEVQS